MIDRGSGAPVVLIPGVQGRWEWMTPTVDELAKHCRVLSFSLGDEPTSGAAVDERAGFDAYLQQVEDALQRANVQQAILIGVSYSGLIATEFACRYPHRVRGLVLVSALPPGWQPDARVRFYMRAPVLLAPVFAVTSPMRLFPEVRAALRTGARVRFMLSALRRALVTESLRHGWRVACGGSKPTSSRMRLPSTSRRSSSPARSTSIESLHRSSPGDTSRSGHMRAITVWPPRATSDR